MKNNYNCHCFVQFEMVKINVQVFFRNDETEAISTAVYISVLGTRIVAHIR